MAGGVAKRNRKVERQNENEDEDLGKKPRSKSPQMFAYDAWRCSDTSGNSDVSIISSSILHKCIHKPKGLSL